MRCDCCGRRSTGSDRPTSSACSRWPRPGSSACPTRRRCSSPIGGPASPAPRSCRRWRASDPIVGRGAGADQSERPGGAHRDAARSGSRRRSTLDADGGARRRRSRVTIGDQDVYASTAGGVKLTEPGLDLGVCLAVVSAFAITPLPADLAVFGEVGLGGELRQVAQAARRLTEAAGSASRGSSCRPTRPTAMATSPCPRGDPERGDRTRRAGLGSVEACGRRLTAPPLTRHVI